ncbi:hypothetical protein M3C00_007720 [Micrococcus luteus]|nr:hypothetical protein [Micrococcus luteus]MCV7588305.1 hypothetical protein [Micrococcus luteus]
MTCTLMATAGAPYDPANFWVAVVTAVGLYALTAFPLWDHIGEASREGREAPTWIFVLAAAGAMLPVAGVLMALDQLTKNPVPEPEHTSAIWTIAIMLTASLVIRVLTPLFLDRTTTPPTPPGLVGTAEVTPLPPASAPIEAPAPSPSPRRRRWVPWAAGAAGVAAGAVLSRRRG